MDFTLERLLCGTQRSEKVKPFPSIMVLMMFNEKIIFVNNGYIESYRNEKTIAANIGYIDSMS